MYGPWSPSLERLVLKLEGTELAEEDRIGYVTWIDMIMFQMVILSKTHLFLLLLEIVLKWHTYDLIRYLLLYSDNTRNWEDINYYIYLHIIILMESRGFTRLNFDFLQIPRDQWTFAGFKVADVLIQGFTYPRCKFQPNRFGSSNVKEYFSIRTLNLCFVPLGGEFWKILS